MAVTLVDIADKSGVSVSTVSRVLSGKSKMYRISERTQKLVVECANTLNYRPNAMARGLRTKKSLSIGLVVPDISNPFFAFITRIIQSHAHNNGYSMIVCNTDENIDSEKDQIELLRSNGVDGMIVMPVGTKYEHIEDLLKNGKPLVLLDRCIEEIETNSVLVDNYDGAYQATDYLISMGHRKIAIILGLPNTSTNNERLKGYKDALRANNIEVDKNYIVGKEYRLENGYIETKFLVNSNDPPTAIFSTSDQITIGALKALSEENIKIPTDVSLIAFDDTEFAPFLESPLTTIRQPKELMGEMAVKLLIEEMKGKQGKKEKSRIVLKPKLIIRKSVSELKVVA